MTVRDPRSSTVLPSTVLAWVASQSCPSAVRRQSRGGVGAVDLDVVAVAAVEDVGAGPAEQHVVTRAAEDGVVAGAADQHVVTGAAAQREQRRIGGNAGRVDDVVAGERVDGDPIVPGAAPVTATAGRQAEDVGSCRSGRSARQRRRRWWR